ncbi:ABC transporter substrate-binding protein [Clostridium guangxiense]|uniref:ABC transporter substrate-binding protein n=1 Tax=Clostridium guangxiense TaxID=1662055 RepID=UPI001E285C69|nr:ABC transporter substrate-binding protein [Clostridium guangxiense]MCD2348962.1 ABC transporter substrate-binding protein [Clostridium guangxiense]
MKCKKILSLLAAVTITGGLLAGCGSSSSSSGSGSSKKVKISIMNSKGEIQSQLEEAVKTFSKANPNITIDVVACSAGQSPFEKLSTMYSSQNAPALAIVDPGDVIKFKDKFADLSNEKWVKDAQEGSLDTVKLDGKVMGFPLTVEGDGIIYNKKVLDKAGVDPTKIKTTNDLEDAFKKVQATGVSAVAVSPMDWSLGSHFFGTAYATQSKDSKENAKFLDDLKAGKVNLTQNKQFTGLLGTLDVLKKYNIDKSDALAATYEKDQQYIGEGKVGFWFMGNWAWPQVKQFSGDNKDFGFIPVPISNNADDYGNSGIAVGVTKYIGVDKVNNNADQQAAAKKFLNWLVYNKDGEDILVKKASVITAFKNITEAPDDPLSKSIKEHMTSKNTIEFMTVLPSDHGTKVGAAMQKYLANKTDKAALANEIQEYWKTVK